LVIQRQVKAQPVEPPALGIPQWRKVDADLYRSIDGRTNDHPLAGRGIFFGPGLLCPPQSAAQTKPPRAGELHVGETEQGRLRSQVIRCPRAPHIARKTPPRIPSVARPEPAGGRGPGDGCTPCVICDQCPHGCPVRRQKSSKTGEFPSGISTCRLCAHVTRQRQNEDKQNRADEKAVADRRHGPKGAA